ncbi:hypothetical protein BKA69DRAFT_526118 [Paraphysoderma sedebokerense]|nr:hypothetical protein BKA69DRAFT_526118 [Paraphysoderma sedebokerense]
MSLWKHVLGVALLCWLYCMPFANSSTIPSPYFLQTLTTKSIPTGAVVVESAVNSTHILILDSYYALRAYAYGSSGSIVYTRGVDVSPWFPKTGSSWSYSRFTTTGSITLHPQTGEVFLAHYYPDSYYATLLVWKLSPQLDFITWFQISREEKYFQQQAKNIRINLYAENRLLYVGIYHNNALTAAAPGFFIAKYNFDTNGYSKIQSSDNALAIDFACNSVPFICVWTTSRSVTRYRMDTLSFVQNSTLTLGATPVNFDPVIRNFANTGDSVYFQRQSNDSSRYVVMALTSRLGVMWAAPLPYIAFFPQIPSYDCKIDSEGNIFTAFTSNMNASIGLGGTEIIVSKINSTSGSLLSTVAISTARQDNVSRIHIPNSNSILVTGSTDGDMSSPSTAVGRRIFLARFQQFSVRFIQTITPQQIQKGETFKVSFTSLPSEAASAGVPSVTLQNRACSSVNWVNSTTISAVAPTGIGRSIELLIVFSYLPHKPSVVDYQLSYPNPVITSVAPAQGPATGFPITVTANNLGVPVVDSVDVTIGGYPCVNVTQISADKVTCRVPPGTGTQYRLVVSTVPTIRSLDNVFISYDPPLLTAVSPTVGPAAGKSIIRISGQNFGRCPQNPPCSSNISVTIGGKSCSSVLLYSDVYASCESPANIGANHSVIINVAGRTAQNISALYSYERPAISSLVPSTASNPNPTIYIEGANFGIYEIRPVVQLLSENGTFECPTVTWKSDSGIKCDFNNVSLPMDVTFLVTVSVGGQLNRENQNATFRTGVINSPPSAQQCSITMLEDTVTVIQLQGTDPDSGDVVQMYVLSAPENGQLYQFSPTALNSKGQPIDPSLSPIPVSDSLGRVVYIPQAEYNGNDIFIFLARDQYLTESTEVAASITIQEVADLPTPIKATYLLFEDEQTIIQLGAFDPDSPLSEIEFYILSVPRGQLLEVDANGSVSNIIQALPYHLMADRVLYIPPENEYGDYFTSFTFSVSDGPSPRVNRNATVSISIQSVNDIPVASNMSYQVPEDGDLTIFFGCIDVDVNDRNSIIIKGVPPPEAGLLYQADQQFRAVLDRNGRIYENDTVIGSAIVFMPENNYFGNFSFPYSCVDSNQAESFDGAITVDVLNINDVPIANNIAIQIPEDSSVEFLLDPTDVESPFESLDVIILDLPLQGLLYIESTSNETNTTWSLIDIIPLGPTASKRLKYIPAQNSFGLSVFHYVAQDETDVSVFNGTVVILVEPINDPPTLILPGNAMEFFEDTSVVIPFTVLDVDEGQPLVKARKFQDRLIGYYSYLSPTILRILLSDSYLKVLRYN